MGVNNCFVVKFFKEIKMYITHNKATPIKNMADDKVLFFDTSQ